MSSLSSLNPGFRLNAVRLASVAGFATLLVMLGFLVPFWIVLIVALGLAGIARMVRGVRAASRRIDLIMAEELSPNDAVE
ncbi:MAG: hypothetical protein ABW224_15620 [Kibdelosporangium sp.]